MLRSPYPLNVTLKEPSGFRWLTELVSCTHMYPPSACIWELQVFYIETKYSNGITVVSHLLEGNALETFLPKQLPE